MGPIGYPEMMFIFILALLLFGPKKLPELGKTLGKALTEFNRAKNELKTTFDREMKTLERETESIKEATNSLYHDNYNYDYSSYDSAHHAAELPETPALEASAIPSASAPQGAESTHAAEPAFAPEGTIANGSYYEPAPAELHSSVPGEAAEPAVKS
ncbi:MAG: TatA/E family twin arginine-targeting protein translocase [Acidobacteriota bacterium]|nr:TatA/E family twin arginine-targeting protein translocase [Acidobacteriota bacterium]